MDTSRPFSWENNHLKDVRVNVPKEPVLKDALDAMMSDMDLTTPAQKNFLAAERRLPSKK